MSMFSSFAQFLPSAIQSTITPHAAPPTEAEERPPPESNFDPCNTDDEGDEEDLLRQQSQQMDEQDGDKRRVKSKKEKDASKMVSETFIFVRPPPSKTNHPLNLQVQLVPPSARPPSGVAVPASRPTTPVSASSTASSMTDGASLARTSSNRSDYSSAYASNSTTSIASYASSSAETSSSTSTSSGRGARRIIPLYNLQAHNVLPNVIADAGTDAKIAKFQKKGLELIDLAVLEPVEVWGVKGKSGEKQAKKQGMRISVDEMGSIVHTGLATNCARPPDTGRKGSFLLPKNNGSRPATPSANSSAVSVASNFSNQPQVTGSPQPRLRELHPPASAPPQSAAFPSSQLPQPSKPIPITPSVAREERPSHDATPPAIVISTTPTKKPSSSSLFGKLKFNTKRNSALNPLVESPATSPTPNPPIQAQQSELAKLAMTTSPVNLGRPPPRQPASLPTPLSPSSISSQHSNTPTPTPTTPNPRGRQAAADEDDVGETPTSSPARPAFAQSSEGGGPSPRMSAIGGAFTRGRNKFVSGFKNAATAPLVEEPPNSAGSSTSFAQPPPQQLGGAKGFFNKIAAGIAGERGAQQEGSSAAGVGKRSSGIFSIGRDGVNRDSADSESSAGRTASPFGKLLYHSNSQQFIGKGNGNGAGSAGSSVNPSPRPSQDASSSNGPTHPIPLFAGATPSGPNSVAGSHISALPSTPSHTQNFNAPPPPTLAQHVSLRQLQLRPPVLGIQPTYVSASTHSQDASTVNLGFGPTGQPLATVVGQDLPTPGFTGDELSHSASYSTLGETEESMPTSSVQGRKRKTSKTQSSVGGNSRRGSLNLERDKDGLLVVTSASGGSNAGASSTALAGSSSKDLSAQGQGKEKERALMYVWLVAKWLKKREAPPSRATSEYEASGGGGERLRARELFRDILPRRDRDRGNSNAEKEAKRGSWHAGAGVGLLPHLGGHGQQPSNTSGPLAIGMQGQPLVLGPLVGGGFEVRFEWKRAKKSKGKNKGDENDKRGRRKEKETPAVKKRDMAKEEEGGVEDTPRPPQGMPPTTSRMNRVSTSGLAGDGLDDSPTRSSDSPSRRSVSGTSSRRRVSLLLKRKEGLEEDGVDDDDEDDSDSEDSETPWICTLKLRKIGYVQAPGGSNTVVDALATGCPPTNVTSLSSKPGGESGVNGRKGEKGEKEQTARLKVGTLSPTPHHPKVVAMLKVPFPLPDVEVERMKFVKRKAFPGQSEEEARNDPYYGVTLTAEDIKDIVCSTGLWLVVRESIGGVGKVNRKGDGWKIRG